MLATTIDQRLTALQQWLFGVIPNVTAIKPLLGDASFRRYFRVFTPDQTYIAMDAPPDKEDIQPFIAHANLLRNHLLKVPQIYAQEAEQGFLLLDDFGDQIFLSSLSFTDPNKIYELAIQELIKIQKISINAGTFELFDKARFLMELESFSEWYLQRYKGLELTSTQYKLLQNTYELLIQNAISQPQVYVHRDYHSRNLMLLQHNSLGILDFQDALWGPVTYDLVSLIRDCYVDWPDTLVQCWLQSYYQQACAQGILQNYSFDQFQHWFDWMGMQRHLKAIYIFARKFCRDGTSAYLNDIPRALNYIYNVCKRYQQFAEFGEFLLVKVGKP